METPELPIPPMFLQPEDSPPISEELWEQILASAKSEPDERRRERWSIRSEGDAQWAMAELAELTDAIEDVEAQAAGWIGRIQEWVEQTSWDDRRRAWALEAHLTRWGLEQREANPKKATFKLVAGEVATTNRKASVEIEDQAAVIDWLKTHYNGQFVRIKEDVLVSELRDIVQIRERVVSSWVALSCGHETGIDGMTARGEMTRCAECDELLNTGPSVVAEVLHVVTEEIVLPKLPLGENADRPIPGTRINPARTTVKVKPRIL